MNKQNYSNHKRYYFQHHFLFYPVLGILLLFCMYYGFQYSENKIIWAVISALCGCVIWLSFMMRQHYALGNQNRIVLLEMHLRYFMLTGKRLEDMHTLPTLPTGQAGGQTGGHEGGQAGKENKLSFKQIAALRFAPDEEFLPLLERALNENLSPDAIKRAIKNWKADDRRV